MLAQFLENSDSAVLAEWQEVIPGLRVCRFTVGRPSTGFPISLPAQLEPLHYEALYCCGGGMMLRWKQGGLLTAGKQDVLLLSDCGAPLQSAQITGPLSGVLVAVDGRTASDAQVPLSQLLGDMDLHSSQLRAHMADRDGCSLLRTAPWCRSVFAALDTLPVDEQSRYCALKTMELSYLLRSNNPLLEEEASTPSPDSYLTRTVADIRAYMEHHLEDKLTIEALSHQFHISPTAFKSCFRRLYGLPVHRWLQTRRMERAAELLQTTPMTVLQIAQAVGYEGASQFNAAFKRQFGVTPRQHKKMSKTAFSYL